MRSYWNTRLKYFLNLYVVFNIHESWGMSYVFFISNIREENKVAIGRAWRTFYFYCLFFGKPPSMIFWWRRSKLHFDRIKLRKRGLSLVKREWDREV